MIGAYSPGVQYANRVPSRPPVHPRTTAEYVPLPWQVPALFDYSFIELLTGSAGGGKSRTAAEKVHAYLKTYAGATGLVLRKIAVTLNNSTIPFYMRRIIGEDPTVIHRPSYKRFEYSNGSVLIYGGMEDEKQRTRLRSIGGDGGVDIVWMEEASEFEEDDFEAVLPRVRGKAAPWRQILLSTNPDAETHWINVRLILGAEACVHYSHAAWNPHNPPEYLRTLSLLRGVDAQRMREGKWVTATGLVFDVWVDDYTRHLDKAQGNVRAEADFDPDGGDVYWWVDDGYSGRVDLKTRIFTSDSHPRVILMAQVRADGTVVVFNESYKVETLPEDHIREVLAMDYPRPRRAIVDKSAKVLRRMIRGHGIPTAKGAPTVEESIKEVRNWAAPDVNGVRRLIVHPRCMHLRREMSSYKRAKDGKIVKAHDHGPDAVRYGIWRLRHYRGDAGEDDEEGDTDES